MCYYRSQENSLEGGRPTQQGRRGLTRQHIMPFWRMAEKSGHAVGIIWPLWLATLLQYSKSWHSTTLGLGVATKAYFWRYHVVIVSLSDLVCVICHNMRSIRLCPYPWGGWWSNVGVGPPWFSLLVTIWNVSCGQSKSSGWSSRVLWGVDVLQSGAGELRSEGRKIEKLEVNDTISLARLKPGQMWPNQLSWGALSAWRVPDMLETWKSEDHGGPHFLLMQDSIPRCQTKKITENMVTI